MYLAFFGLNEKPFSITPDPRYLYLSERHSEALAHLLYGVNEAGGFVQLTGEVGTGKTTVIRSLLAQTPKHAEVALILNPRMTPAEFLLTICEELGIGVPDSAIGSIKDLVDILNAYLLRAHADGRRIVLVVDEAQNLAPEVLEQVRLLTNLETETRKLLQIILIGQPELRVLLDRIELRQLAQRITGRYHLAPLSREETSAYVRHRLRIAGATSDLFLNAALREVHRLSGGVPRVINVVCDRALLGAYTQDRHHVTPAIVRRAASEVFGRRFAPLWVPWAVTAAAVLLFVVGAVGLWRFVAGRDAAVPAPGAALAAAPAPTPAANPREAEPAQAARGSVPADATGGAAVSPAAASPATAPAAGTMPAAALATLLAQHEGETDTDNAFNKLFALWGLRYIAGSVDACTQAAQAGLECLVQRGTLAQLRLYNRPAMLLISDDAGETHQIVLTALETEHGRIDLGGAQHRIGVGDLSRYWFGDYLLLWRRGPGSSKDLSYGMRGEEVRWLRQSLERLEGRPPSTAPSELFDADLAELVKEFQRRHRLAADGIAGVQTRIMLDTALAAPDTPWLQVSARNQGG